MILNDFDGGGFVNGDGAVQGETEGNPNLSDFLHQSVSRMSQNEGRTRNPQKNEYTREV